MSRAKPRIRLWKNGKYWQCAAVDHRGRRHVKSIGRRDRMTRSEAWAKCQAIGREIENPKAPRISQWIEQYLQLRAEYSSQTIELYELTGRYLIEYFKDRPIDQVDDADATRFRNWLAERMSETSVCTHIRNCKALFGRRQGAVRYGHVTRNPFEYESGSPPAPDKTWRRLTESEIDATLGECRDYRVFMAVALCAYAGLRRHEALSLQWKDIDLFRRRLWATTTKQMRGRPRRREVLICKELCLILYDYLMEEYAGEFPADHVKVCDIRASEADAGLRRAMADADVVPWADPWQSLRRWRDSTWKMLYKEWVVDLWMGHTKAVSERYYLTVPEEYYNGEQSDIHSLSPRTHAGPPPQASKPGQVHPDLHAGQVHQI